MSELSQLAKNLARNCGYHVLPLNANKSPCWSKGHEGGKGFYDATTDQVEIDRLFGHRHARLIGVRTGQTSGISVLDVDKHHDGFAWLEENQHRLPATRTHETRRGGKHLVFLHMPGLRCSIGTVGKGIDIRAEGGFCTWWPAVGLPILDHSPPAAWPLWLVPPPPPVTTRYEASGPRAPVHVEASLSGLVRTVAGALEGQRNASLFWAANRVAELVLKGELSKRHAEAVLIEAASIAGLDHTEAARTINSAFRRAA